MKTYHKIKTLFKRDEKTKKLLQGEFINEAIEFLANNTWQFTEKIDGTNIRICWDGYKVKIAGRTEKSNIPIHLSEKLNALFSGETNEQMFEQKFGESEVILFGEGYGHKIQAVGGLYLENDVDFILFDVMINGNYQSRETVEEVAGYFGIDVVPVLCEGTLEQGIEYVKTHPKSTIGEAAMEGLVARPKVELQDRTGERVIIKIKYRDFKEEL